jgi:hypothetical protein
MRQRRLVDFAAFLLSLWLFGQKASPISQLFLMGRSIRYAEQRKA